MQAILRLRLMGRMYAGIRDDFVAEVGKQKVLIPVRKTNLKNQNIFNGCIQNVNFYNPSHLFNIKPRNIS